MQEHAEVCDSLVQQWDQSNEFGRTSRFSQLHFGLDLKLTSFISYNRKGL